MLRLIWFKGFVSDLCRNIRSIVIYVLDSFLLFIPRANTPKTKISVLIVRLDAIGDFVLWLDSAKEMRKYYPEDTHRIFLLANIIWAPLASSLPHFDEVWAMEKGQFYKKLSYRWHMIYKVRRRSFDIVIHPTFSREFLFGDSIVRLSGAGVRIGSAGDDSLLRFWLKPIADAWYSKLIPATSKPLMELERNAEFIRGLGLKDFRAALPKLSVTNYQPVMTSDYCVICPGSFMPCKQWNIDYFLEISRRLHSATGWHTFVCGGLGEEYLGYRFVTSADFPVTNLIGSTSLMELIALINHASMVIANDSSAIHIAAAVSTPAICILGGGHYGRFMPYATEVAVDTQLPIAVSHKMDCFGCNWHCIYDVPPGSAMPCIERVTVEDLWAEVVKMLPEVLQPRKEN